MKPSHVFAMMWIFAITVSVTSYKLGFRDGTRVSADDAGDLILRSQKLSVTEKVRCYNTLYPAVYPQNGE